MTTHSNRRELLRASAAGAAALLSRPVRAQAPVSPKALIFDTFGTVVDWRGSIIAEGAAWGKAKGLYIDWGKFGDGWRAGYGPLMERVRIRELTGSKLDVLPCWSLA